MVLDVVREDAELLDLDQVHHAERLALAHGVEREDLKARAAGLGTLGDEHEVERRPVAAHHVKDRPVAALVLDGDELLGGGPALHGDEIFLLVTIVQALRDAKVGREVLAAKAQWRLAGAEGLHVVAGAAKDRRDQRFGDAALGLQEIHPTSFVPPTPAPQARFVIVSFAPRGSARQIPPSFLANPTGYARLSRPAVQRGGAPQPRRQPRRSPCPRCEDGRARSATHARITSFMPQEEQPAC